MTKNNYNKKFNPKIDEKDYETLRWQLTSTDLLEDFDLNIKEEEISNYEIIITINYEQESITYNALHKEQEMSDLSDDQKYNFDDFLETVEYLKKIAIERSLENIETKIDNILTEINLLAIYETIDKKTFTGYVIATAKLYLLEEDKEEYDYFSGWEIIDRQAYKDGYMLEVSKTIDPYDFSILENIETNDYANVLQQEIESCVEYNVISQLQHTCKKILSIYLY